MTRNTTLVGNMKLTVNQQMQRETWASAKIRWVTDSEIKSLQHRIATRKSKIHSEEVKKWNITRRKMFLEKCRQAGAPVMAQETKRWESDENIQTESQ